MELLIADKYYDSDSYEAGRYTEELKILLQAVDPDVSTAETNIGHGADFPTILVQLFKGLDITTLLTAGGLGAIVLGGEKISKSIGGWVEAAKKLNKLYEQICPTRIDESAALLLAIDDLHTRKFNLTAENLINISTQVIELAPVACGQGTLGHRPDCVYVFTIKLAEQVFIYGIRSDSTIDFIKEYSSEWHEFHNKPKELAVLADDV